MKQVSDFDTALAATAQDFEQAHTPPGRVFWDEGLYARELDDVFRRMWLCVLHASRLKVPGDFFVVDFGPESIVVVADDDIQPRAYHNVCRHRGTRLVSEPTGRTMGIRCPYHAWNYGLDGQLRAAPGMEATPHFCRSDFPLLDVRIDIFRGFLFICLDSDAEPLGDAFADFPSLEVGRLENVVRVARHDYNVASNWKLICENYHECYHCAVAHPQLHRISDYDTPFDPQASGRLFVGGPMRVKPPYSSMTMSGASLDEDQGSAEGASTAIVHYFNLLPNFLLSIAPDYVLTHHIWPRGPESVYIESEWFCAPDLVAQDRFSIEDAETFWDVTNQQDWNLCETALKGLKSSYHRPGRYHPDEHCAHRFDRWYVERMFPELCKNNRPNSE